MNNMLELEGIGKRRGDFQLRDITFSLPEGCIMGLIGSNGAGKTTLISIILNFINQDCGSINTNLEDEDDIGVVLDSCCFHELFTSDEVGRVLSLVHKKWDEKTYNKYISRFGIPAGKKIKEFSLGMKMKLSLAAAMSHGAKLLLLDEALSGLDPVARNDMLEVFLEYIQDGRKSIILSSHITGDLEKISDYITFIDGGKLIESRSKDDILDDYGVVKAAEGDIEKLDSKDIIGRHKTSFSDAALIKNKYGYRHKYKDMVIDDASLEDIMTYYAKGDRV